MHTKVSSDIRMNLLAIGYDAGGNFEKDGNRGTSHLMEHLMCKTFDDQLSKMKRLGIDYNAFTSDKRVVFHFSGLEESIEEMGQLFFDRITKQEVLWDKESFENEKRTVLQEYGDAFNSQVGGFIQNVIRKHYGSAGAIGIREDIENFTYEDSLECAKFYKTPRFVCEVGKSVVTPAEFAEELTQFSYKFGEKSLEEEPNVPKEGKTAVGLLGTKPMTDANHAKLSLIIECITGGIESPLYKEIREDRGLSYFSAGTSFNVGLNEVPVFLASTTNDKAEEVGDVYREFFDRNLSDIVSEERFDVCKSSILVDEKKAERLPHSGAMATIVKGNNPFEGIAELTYEDAIETFSDLFSNDNLMPISY